MFSADNIVLKRLMKYMFIFIVLLVTLPFVNAKVIYDNQFLAEDTLTIENIPYKIGFNTGKESLMLETPFFALFLEKDKCKKIDYYTFCFNGYSDLNLLPPRPKAHLKVTREDNCELTSEFGTQRCIGSFYTSCIEDSDCESNKCTGFVCSELKTYCGDGYCHETERFCLQDCQPSGEIISINPYSFNVSAINDWTDTNFVFKKDTKYNVSIDSNYELNYARNGKFTSYNSTFESGVLLLRLCDKIYSLKKDEEILLHSECRLETRINDKILVDNSGSYIINVTDLTSKLLAEKIKEEQDILNKKNEELEYEKTNLERDISNLKNKTESSLGSIGQSALDVTNNDSKDEGGFKIIYISIILFIFALIHGAFTLEGKNKWWLVLILVAYQISGWIYVIVRWKHWMTYWVSLNQSSDYKLFRELEEIKKSRKEAQKEYDLNLKEIASLNITKNAKNEKYKKMKEEFDSEQNIILEKLNSLEKRNLKGKSDLNKKINEKIELEKKLTKISEDNAKLKESISKEAYKTKVKKQEFEDLERRYKESVNQAKQEYSGDSEKLANELTGLKEEYDDARESLNEILDSNHVPKRDKKQEIEKQIQEIDKKTNESTKKQILTSEKNTKLDFDILSSTDPRKDVSKNYNDFKDSFETKSKYCSLLPEYVELYYSEYKSTKNLQNLSRFICEKMNTENFELIFDQVIKKYEDIDSAKIFVPLNEMREIDDMSGHDFEDYLGELFKKLGYRSVVTKKARDKGVDLILMKDGEKILIQAKRYAMNQSVGVSAIRDVNARKEIEKATKLIVLTTSMKFSLDARKEAEELNVELWGRNKLKDLLREAKLLENGKN